MRPVLVLTLTVLAIPVALAAPADRFERISPSKAGYDVEGLLELESFLREKGSSSLLLLKDGKVFFEYGDIRKPHLVHSIRKALLNSLVGIAVHQGEINLDATLEDLGVDDVAPSLTDRERQARVIDLLESRSGVYHPATAESPGMLAGKPPRGSHAPGSHFYYNNWDFNAAGGIYEQLTGRRIFDDFQSRIAEPLGMLDYQGRISTLELPTEEELPEADGIYQFERALSDYPAYHFRLSTHDLALYGQLFLQRGHMRVRRSPDITVT